MAKWSKLIALTGTAAVLALGSTDALAQQDNQGGGRRGNFDPAQMRQRMTERYKEMLEITSDDEWKAVEPLITKVNEVRMQTMGGMGRGMFGGPGGQRRGGDNQGGGNQGGDRTRMFGQQSAEATALEKAIEAKASKAELKAATEKYVAARKAKQAELQTAQENLRKVLTARQEAIATLNGLL